MQCFLPLYIMFNLLLVLVTIGCVCIYDDDGKVLLLFVVVVDKCSKIDAMQWCVSQTDAHLYHYVLSWFHHCLTAVVNCLFLPTSTTIITLQ